MTSPTLTDPRKTARELRPLIESEAEATDRELTLTKPLAEAFASTGMLHLCVPRELGGSEADTDTILDVFEELAYFDGSVGWTLMAVAAATAYSSFLDPAAARELICSPESAFAGQFSPFADVRHSNGGYRVSGDFQFGSGIAHATYGGGAGFLRGDDGEPEMLAEGVPAYTCFFVPTHGGIELRGGWDTMGLRGTGSFDYRVLEQDVDPGRTFKMFRAEVKTGGPLFGIGPVALAGLGHSGWGLGVAQRALDEIASIAEGGRGRMGALPMRDHPVFLRELGQKSLALRSVRLLAHDAFGSAVERLSRGDEFGPKDVQALSAVTAYLTEVAEDVTLFAYRSAGSQGLRNPSTVQRCFRDFFTGGLHIFVDRRSYEEYAKPLLAGDS